MAGAAAVSCFVFRVWLDLRDAVQAHLGEAPRPGPASKWSVWPTGRSRQASRGCTREWDDKPRATARGTTYVEIDAATGELTYLKECAPASPLFKPGAATADLLKAITAKAAEEQALNGKPAPLLRTAEGVVKTSGRSLPEGRREREARLFADDIR